MKKVLKITMQQEQGEENIVGKVIILIKNEFLKIFNKKSTIVIILIALIAIIAPLVIQKYSKGVEIYQDDTYQDYMKERMQTMLDDNKNKTDSISKIATEVATFNINILEDKIFTKTAKTEEWQLNMMTKYKEIQSIKLIANLMLKGYTLDEIESVDNMYKMYGGESLNLQESERTMLKKAADNKESLKTYIDNKNKESENIKNVLNTSDFKAYLQSEIKYKKNNIIENEKQIKELNKIVLELEKESVKDLENIKALKANVKEFENSNYINNKVLVEYNKFVESTKNTEVTKWQKGAVLGLAENITNVENAKISKKTEAEFYASKAQKETNIKTYKEYEKQHEVDLKFYEENIAKNKYALEKNIAINEDNTAKKAVNGSYTYITSIMAIVGVVLAGVIVANEFATGTIRLLLISPVKRWKILFSKIFTVTCVFALVGVMCFAATILTAGILYGFDSYAVSELIFKDGKIVEQNIIIMELVKMCIACLPGYVFLTFSFMISTVIRSGTLAVGLGLAGMFAGNVVSQLAFILNYAWIKFTPAPYFTLEPLLEKVETQNYAKIIQEDFASGAISLRNGLLMIAAYITVMLVISFISFTKSDIKNQ
ncbi:MAG: ABC transporter permease subunit [Clostridia bacterium]